MEFEDIYRRFLTYLSANFDIAAISKEFVGSTDDGRLVERALGLLEGWGEYRDHVAPVSGNVHNC